MIRIESSLSPINSSRMKHKMKSQNLEDSAIEDSWRGLVFNASPRRALPKRESGVTESPF